MAMIVSCRLYEIRFSPKGNYVSTDWVTGWRKRLIAPRGDFVRGDVGRKLTSGPSAPEFFLPGIARGMSLFSPSQVSAISVLHAKAPCKK
jgi:hypothetical protein